MFKDEDRERPPGEIGQERPDFTIKKTAAGRAAVINKRARPQPEKQEGEKD